MFKREMWVKEYFFPETNTWQPAHRQAFITERDARLANPVVAAESRIVRYVPEKEGLTRMKRRIKARAIAKGLR